MSAKDNSDETTGRETQFMVAMLRSMDIRYPAVIHQGVKCHVLALKPNSDTDSGVLTLVRMRSMEREIRMLGGSGKGRALEEDLLEEKDWFVNT